MYPLSPYDVINTQKTKKHGNLRNIEAEFQQGMGSEIFLCADFKSACKIEWANKGSKQEQGKQNTGEPLGKPSPFQPHATEKQRTKRIRLPVDNKFPDQKSQGDQQDESSVGQQQHL